jgi:hypothetical protein
VTTPTSSALPSPRTVAKSAPTSLSLLAPCVAIHVQALTLVGNVTPTYPVPRELTVTPGVPPTRAGVPLLFVTTALMMLEARSKAEAGLPARSVALDAVVALVALVAVVAVVASVALVAEPAVVALVACSASGTVRPLVLIFAAVTVPFLIFAVVTAPFLSCLVPTLFFGMVIPA